MGDFLKKAYDEVAKSYNDFTKSNKNSYLHHIHVKVGNEIHTLSQFNDYVEIGDLMAAIKDIIDKEAKKRA